MTIKNYYAAKAAEIFNLGGGADEIYAFLKDAYNKERRKGRLQGVSQQFFVAEVGSAALS